MPANRRRIPRPRRCFLLGVAMLLATVPPAWSAGGEAIDYATARLTRRLTAVRATSPIRLDGVLDEADWQQAPMATDFLQREPREGEPASERTEVRVLYDEHALYVGVFARDSEPQHIIVNELKKDFTVESTDTFELVLDTFRDERNGYMFAVNPAGAKWDAQMVNEGRDVNANWDGVWDVRTRMVEEGWVAEIAIPFRTLKFAGAGTQTWGVNFLRRLRRKNEESFWAPLPRIYALPRVSMAGTLEELGGLRPGRNMRVKPYALANVAQAAGGPRRTDPDIGFDAKYGVTSGLTWDFTVNTDFSQVEADEQQINLSRFSLFFPEKRDFFLENSGVFQFGVAAERSAGGGGQGGGGRQNDAARNDVILFFSRTIGLSQNGEAIPIAGGTRLTGRAGGYSLGLLNIQQRRQAQVPATNFTALRLRRDVLASSDIGVMVLNKEESGSGYNRVIGADANFRFFRRLDVNGLAAKTYSPAERVPETGSALMMRSGFTYRGDFWEFRGSHATIGERFRDEMGYVPRVGIDKSGAFAAGHIRPARLRGWLRESWPHWEYTNVVRHDGVLESRYYDYHVPFNFQNGGFTEVGVNRSVEELVAPFTISTRRGIRIPVGRYAFNDYFITFRTNAAARVSGSGRYGYGDFYDGYKHTYQGGIAARIDERFNVSANYTRNAISLPGGSFVTDLLASRINFSFSTRMFVNALVQYNTDARQWTSNVRFNFIHRPLSDVFVVYNERRDSRSGDFLNRAIILKMTYMVAM